MIYCRKCGAKLKDTAKFCDDCGCEVIIIKQKTYEEQYKENKKKEKEKFLTEEERRAKHPNEKNPYVMAGLIAVLISIFLAMFPWNLIVKGIGTSLPMRIAVVAFALLADYHVIKANQVNNYLYKKYGFRIGTSTIKVVNALSVFMTVLGAFVLFMYGA